MFVHVKNSYMEIKLALINNRGFSWQSFNNLKIKGCFDQDIISKLSRCNIFELGNLLLEFHGNFALVKEFSDSIVVAVDIVRSIPLFYAEYKGVLYVCDSVDYLKNKFNLTSFSKEKEYEFLASGFVIADGTLFNEIKQIQAGEMVIFNKNGISVKDYYLFNYNDFSKKTDIQLMDELDNVHNEIAKRLVKSLNGRTAIIPLSGGYDSRLVAEMLKKEGYENVITFSYGRINDWEVSVSREIAKALGFRWEYIEYSRKKWWEWFNDDERKKYMNYACNYSSIAHFQDWGAVFELKKQKRIPNNSIFIPGHTGDFIEGGHIANLFLTKNTFDSATLLDYIIKLRYDNLCIIGDVKIKIAESVQNKYSIDKNYSNVKASEISEKIDWRERQAKFIVNSCRVYDYFGYEWRLPLWDIDLLKFWSKVPFEKRAGRKLYYDYVKEMRPNYNIQANPKQSYFERFIYNYITNVYYGRFNGNKILLLAFLDKTSSLYPIVRKYNIKSTYIYFEKRHRRGLDALDHLMELSK